MVFPRLSERQQRAIRGGLDGWDAIGEVTVMPGNKNILFLEKGRRVHQIGEEQPGHQRTS